LPEPKPLPEPVVAELVDDYVPDLEEILQNDSAESAEPAAESDVVGDWPLMVPEIDGKPSRTVSTHASEQEWRQAYEDLADKTAQAGKRPARQRMTILKELRRVNDPQFKRINSLERINHTQSHNRRINALGAAVPPEEK
jgi:hypothetical protein